MHTVGRPPELPIDIILPTDCQVRGNRKDYINKWKKQIKEAYKIVSKQGKKRDIQHRNSSARFSLGLQPRDYVLVRIISQREGTGKIRDFWEEKVHLIVSGIGDNGVVYKVKQEDEGDIKIRSLHRNMIMKINDMLDNFDSNVSISEKKKVKLKSRKTSNRKIIQRTDKSEETTESDEEYPLQFAPGDLQILIRSSKNNAKRVTLKDLDNKSSKQYNQAARNKKLSKEETYKRSEIDFTVDSSSNLKEPRIKSFIKIERGSRIKN